MQFNALLGLGCLVCTHHFEPGSAIIISWLSTNKLSTATRLHDSFYPNGATLDSKEYVETGQVQASKRGGSWYSFNISWSYKYRTHAAYPSSGEKLWAPAGIPTWKFNSPLWHSSLLGDRIPHPRNRREFEQRLFKWSGRIWVDSGCIGKY